MTPPTRISDHGAKIAAGHIGCTVEEYRDHEAANEHWCPRCLRWVPFEQFSVMFGRGGYCYLCRRAYQGARARYSLTANGADRADHRYCPPALGCRSGRLPAGWVRASEETA